MLSYDENFYKILSLLKVTKTKVIRRECSSAWNTLSP